MANGEKLRTESQSYGDLERHFLQNPHLSSLDYLEVGMRWLKNYVQNPPYMLTEDGKLIPSMINRQEFSFMSVYMRHLGLPLLDNRESYDSAVSRLDKISEDLKACLDLNPLTSFYLMGSYLSLYEEAKDYNPLFEEIINNSSSMIINLQKYIYKIQRRSVDMPEQMRSITIQTDSGLSYQLGDLLALTGNNNFYNDSFGTSVEKIFMLAFQLKLKRNELKAARPDWDWAKIDQILDWMPDGHTMLTESLKSIAGLPEYVSKYSRGKEETPFILHPPTEWTERLSKKMEIEQQHDEQMMTEVLRLAEVERTTGNEEPIICLIENTLTGETLHSANRKPNYKWIHAEELALEHAWDKWSEESIPFWKMYVSVEPCIGCGKDIYQAFPHMKSLSFAAYSNNGIYTDGHYGDEDGVGRNKRKSIRQNGIPLDLPEVEVHSGLLAKEATRFYRDTLGWNKDDMILPYDDVKLNYWQKKWRDLLVSREIEAPAEFAKPIPEEIPERVIDYLTWFSDPEIRKGLFDSTPTDEIGIRNWLESLIGSENKEYRFIKVNNKVIGHVGLNTINKTEGNAEVSIVIGDKKFWGKGTGWAALDEIKSVAKEMGLSTLKAKIKNDNIRSIRLFIDHGFRKADPPQNEEMPENFWYFTCEI